MATLTCTYADGDKVTTYHASQAIAIEMGHQAIRLGALKAHVS